MKRVSRRTFLGGLATVSVGTAAQRRPAPARRPTSIDRQALVRRHNPLLTQLDPLAPLSVGNGEFAFTADITGLQTFSQAYEQKMPLCTQAQWGWHSTPLPPGLDPRGLRLTPYETHGRQVGYAVSSEGQKELYNWLRENPHRLHLGQLGLRMLRRDGTSARVADLTDIEQQLDLWTGVITSKFTFEGVPVTVKTAAHPTRDLVAVALESPLVRDGRLAVRLAFPYGSPAMHAADWQQTGRHISKIVSQTANRVEIERKLNADSYFATLGWQGAAKFTTTDVHEFLLTAQTGERLEFSTAFTATRSPQPLPAPAATFTASAQHWQRFWNEGAAVEFAASNEARAGELERRVVLSQYLTAIQCAGSLPPQETGLTVNSWYGKFHLEMHWWHAAHFALWNRLPLLERSLGYYSAILPQARALAKAQGYAGARWPKMTARDGLDSPSAIGPLLIWQQPHPIFYAELCYLNRRDRRTLERYREIVFASAEFMAAFAHFDEPAKRYVLGPPVIPAQENHPPRETWNPTFELSYWRWGLQTAQRWRERLGLKRSPAWERVLKQLAPLSVRDGVYLAHENCPQTFSERNRDHPSMLGSLGMLPGADVDRATMRRTLQRAWQEWRWDETWGWDYPLTALTAARVGEPQLAVNALLMRTAKNRYLPNGHNYQRENLPCYLPGNGGLLYAVALMAAGWKDAPHSAAPGFPADGSWTVRAEGFNPAVLKEL
jgi:hypothetical protein